MAGNRITLRKVSNSLRTDLAQIDLIMKDYAGFVERYAERMDAYLYRAVASFMTDFYLCAETMFTTIAEELDGGAPRGCNWHKRLLASMAIEIKGVRPAVISSELCAALTPFLVFRHVIPQAYGSTFNEKKLAALEIRFQPTRGRFSAEMRAFCDFLERATPQKFSTKPDGSPPRRRVRS